MSVLSNMSACQVDVFLHVEYVGGNFSATRHPCRCAYALPTCPEKSQVGGRTGNFRGPTRRLRNHARAPLGTIFSETYAASPWRTRGGAFGRQVCRLRRHQRKYSGQCGRGPSGSCRAWATDPEQRRDDSGKTVLAAHGLRRMSGVSANAIQGCARGEAVNA